MKFLLQTSILWLPLSTIRALWIGAITGYFERTSTLLLGTLAVTSQFLKLKKSMSTILNHTSFFTAKFEFLPGSTKYFDGLPWQFWHFRQVFGWDIPTYNPSPVWELALLIEFSGTTTLQSLVLEKQCKGAWQSMVLSMWSDDLT